MLSAAPPPFSSSSPPPPLLREVQVLYRRVCVMRASGKSADADALESGKLAETIAKLRESSATSAGPEALEKRLEALFAAENERVDTAHALAELLLPMLTAADESGAPFRRARSSPEFDRPNGISNSPQYDSSPADSADSSNNTGSPLLPGIADFIDEMLVQERVPTEPRNPRRPH